MDKRRWTNASAVRAHYEARDAIAGDSPGAECITVSIDGATGATYKTIRRGARQLIHLRAAHSVRHGRHAYDLGPPLW